MYENWGRGERALLVICGICGLENPKLLNTLDEVACPQMFTYECSLLSCESE